MHYIPDPSKAVDYKRLFLEKDGIEACGHYSNRPANTPF